MYRCPSIPAWIWSNTALSMRFSSAYLVIQVKRISTDRSRSFSGLRADRLRDKSGQSQRKERIVSRERAGWNRSGLSKVRTVCTPQIVHSLRPIWCIFALNINHSNIVQVIYAPGNTMPNCCYSTSPNSVQLSYKFSFAAAEPCVRKFLIIVLIPAGARSSNTRNTNPHEKYLYYINPNLFTLDTKG